MKPWRLYDDEGRLDLTLTPCYDRTTRMKVLFVDNCCHQMFGGFSGRAVAPCCRSTICRLLPNTQ